MDKKGKQENTIHWVCTKCGHSSPITEKTCINPSCQADLTTYGQKVGKRTSADTEKKSSSGLVAGIIIGLVIGALGVYFYMAPLNGNPKWEEVKNSSEGAGISAIIDQEEMEESSDFEDVSEQTSDEAEEKWKNNILMENIGEWETKEERPEAKVLGSEIARKDILSVTVFDSLADVPEDSWDVSQDQNGSVMAWVERNGAKYDLYIAGEGGINAKNCNNLFAGYINAERIDLNGSFHTDYAEDMTSLFDNCHSVQELDVSDFNTEHVTSMYGMFSECESLKTLDVSHFDTSKVTTMYAMFNKCAGIEELDVSSFHTENVTNMAYMFNGCKEVKKLEVSNFDTSKVTTMYAMFATCKSLGVLDVSKFNTANVTDMACFVADCSGLVLLDVSGFDTSKVETMYAMFLHCANLEGLDVSHFNTKKVTNMELMFYGCSCVDETDIVNFDMRNVENKENIFR